MATTMRGQHKRQSNDYNWDAEIAALHEKTQALNLYEFWSVGKPGNTKLCVTWRNSTRLYRIYGNIKRSINVWKKRGWRGRFVGKFA